MPPISWLKVVGAGDPPTPTPTRLTSAFHLPARLKRWPAANPTSRLVFFGSPLLQIAVLVALRVLEQTSHLAVLSPVPSACFSDAAGGSVLVARERETSVCSSLQAIRKASPTGGRGGREVRVD